MRRAVAVVVGTGLLLGGAVAGTGNAKAAREKVERRETNGYVGGRGSVPGGQPELYTDEAVFETLAHERRVSIVVNDRSGQAVSATLRQDADGDGTWEVDEAFCGTTTQPVAIRGGSPVVIKVQPGPCADGTPAVMTSGAVEVTFTGFVKSRG